MKTLQSLHLLANNLCVCGSNINYEQCCEPFLKLEKLPASPEQLMRSRYTAYAVNDIDYISDTMMGKAAQKFNLPETKASNQQIQWLSLEILRSEESKRSGIVEYIAQYQFAGELHILHEVSQFGKIENRWFYIDGYYPNSNSETLKAEAASQHNPSEKSISRNDPCFCGSGLKYKKCCRDLKR